MSLEPENFPRDTSKIRGLGWARETANTFLDLLSPQPLERSHFVHRGTGWGTGTLGWGGGRNREQTVVGVGFPQEC